MACLKDCVIPGILNNEVPANPAVDPLIARLSEGFATGTKFKVNGTKPMFR